MMNRIWILAGLLALVTFTACGDECIRCQNVNGYPSTTICKDTYQTTISGQDPSWVDYRDAALEKGCVKQ